MAQRKRKKKQLDEGLFLFSEEEMLGMIEYGVKTVHLGIEGAKDEKQAWKVKCAHKSPNYLTNINEILTIKI